MTDEQPLVVKETASEAPMRKFKRKGFSTKQIFGLGIVVILLLALLVGWVVAVRAVGNLSQNKTVLKAAKVLDLPAAKVNGLKIKYADYIRDIQTLNKFYSSSTDTEKPTEEQISDQVLSRLIANLLIAEEAKKYDVKIMDEDVNNMKKEILAQFESEEAARSELMNRYGWTLEDYTDQVIRPLLVEQKLQEAFVAGTDEEGNKYLKPEIKASHILFQVADEKDDVKVKVKAEAVLKRIKNGEDFAKLAGEFGSDSTKSTGGDLGWFGEGDMVPEFEEAVFALNKDQLGEQLVKTEFGYHIIKVTDKRTARDFVSYMDDQIKNAKFKLYIPVHNPFESLK